MFGVGGFELGGGFHGLGPRSKLIPSNYTYSTFQFKPRSVHVPREYGHKIDPKP